MVITEPDVSTMPPTLFYDSESISTGVTVAVTLMRPNLWILVVERKVGRYKRD